MGYWTWFAPEAGVLPYFDVPVSNFIGWFIILSFYSFFHLRWKNTPIRKKLLGFDAVLPALPALLLAITIMIGSEYERLFINLSWWVMMVIFIVPLVIILAVWLFSQRAALSKKAQQQEQKQSLKVPFFISHAFHGFFLLMAIYVGITTADWRYFIAAIVAGLPLLAQLLPAKTEALTLKTNFSR